MFVLFHAAVAYSIATQKTFVLINTYWRRLEDFFSITLFFRRLADFSSITLFFRRLEDFFGITLFFLPRPLQGVLEDVLKTSCEDVLRNTTIKVTLFNFYIFFSSTTLENEWTLSNFSSINERSWFSPSFQFISVKMLLIRLSHSV